MFVYILLKFDSLIIFFSRQSAKKVENSELFLLLSFQMSQFRMLRQFSARAEILTEWKTTLMVYK